MNTETTTNNYQEGLKDGFMDAMILSEKKNQEEDIDFFRVYTKYGQCCASFDLPDYEQGYERGFDCGAQYLVTSMSFN